jgi:hypothetical protein
MKRFLLISLMAIGFGPSTALAGACEIQYTRTACPGKEEISYKKCDGQQSCSKFKEASSAQECAEMAVNSCKNKRFSVTKLKVINALFDGQPIKASNGSDDFCTVYENASEEFNKCDG